MFTCVHSTTVVPIASVVIIIITILSKSSMSIYIYVLCIARSVIIRELQ